MRLLVDGPEANVLCYFRLVLLIEEDKRVMAGVPSVEESPSDSWMGRVVKFSTKRGAKLNWRRVGGWGKRDSGVVTLGKVDWLVTLNTVVAYEGFDLV